MPPPSYSSSALTAAYLVGVLAGAIAGGLGVFFFGTKRTVVTTTLRPKQPVLGPLSESERSFANAVRVALQEDSPQ